MTVFTVYRYEIFRPRQVDHQFELFLEGVTGHVDLGNLFVDDVGASLVELVDDVVNAYLESY